MDVCASSLQFFKNRWMSVHHLCNYDNELNGGTICDTIVKYYQNIVSQDRFTILAINKLLLLTSNSSQETWRTNKKNGQIYASLEV
jgi:hypothetical protein